MDGRGGWIHRGLTHVRFYPPTAATAGGNAAGHVRGLERVSATRLVMWLMPKVWSAMY
jgi:hypothetical protein